MRSGGPPDLIGPHRRPVACPTAPPPPLIGEGPAPNVRGLRREQLPASPRAYGGGSDAGFERPLDVVQQVGRVLAAGREADEALRHRVGAPAPAPLGGRVHAAERGGLG